MPFSATLRSAAMSGSSSPEPIVTGVGGAEGLGLLPLPARLEARLAAAFLAGLG